MTEESNNKIDSQDLTLELSTYYHLGKGALWGSHDFWMGVLESLTAGFIFLPISVVANLISNKIYETFKTSKSESDIYQSCRFDLLIPIKKHSGIILRFFRTARFRTKRDISEKDINDTIIAAIDKYNEISKKAIDDKFVITVELTNYSDKINIKFSENVDIDSNYLDEMKIQFKKSGKEEKIKIDIKQK
jgi:hypothetical protein